MAVLSSRVKALRERHGWNVTKLGSKLQHAGLKWDRFTVTALESGKRQNVTVVEWLTLAYVLDVAPVHLLIEPEVPGASAEDAKGAYQVTPNRTLPRAQARAWVRGMDFPPDTDLRIFYSEIPAGEWGNVWALTRRPADVDEDAKFSEPSKWLRRSWAMFTPDQLNKA